MLNQSEAVYGFAGWLTSRKERTTMSASDDAAPIAELVKEFCEVNNLPEISGNWPNELIHPTPQGEQCAHVKECNKRDHDFCDKLCSDYSGEVKG